MSDASTEEDRDDVAGAAKRKQGPRLIRLDDGSTVKLPTQHLSPSAADMYLKCPRAYWFRYILGEKTPPGVAQVLGTSGHEALRYANYRLLRKGEYPKTSRVVERFRAAWADGAKTILQSTWHMEGTNRNRAEADVLPSLRHYMDDLAPRLEVTMAERPYRRNVAGLPVMGILDVMVGDPRDKAVATVYDYKFCGPSSGYLRQTDADQSLQLATYALLTNVRRAGYVALVKGKTPRVVVVKTGVNPHRKADTRAEYVQVARGINAGAFPKCKPNFLCSARFCGYHKWCRGAKSGQERRPD